MRGDVGHGARGMGNTGDDQAQRTAASSEARWRVGAQELTGLRMRHVVRGKNHLVSMVKSPKF